MSTSLPLSFHQERLWFIDTFEKGKLYEASPVYHNLPLLLKIDGPLDRQCLQAAIDYLVARHEVLRYSLQSESTPAIALATTSSVPLAQHPLPDVADGIAAALQPYVRQAFDLYSGAMHRPTLFSDEREQHYLLWVFHHFIADRFSLQTLFDELIAVYRQLEQGHAPALAPLELQYGSYARWQKEFPEETVEALLLYWKHELKGNVQALEIAPDYPRDHIHLYDGDTYAFRIPAPLAGQLQALGAAQGCSGKEVLLTAFLVLLHHYSGLAEVVVGTFGDNHRQQLGAAAGPADNLLVLRTHLDLAARFDELLGQVAGQLEEAQAYQDLPFEQLCTLLNPAKDMSRTAFFDVLFHYEAASPAQPTAHATWAYLETNYGLGKYDLNLLFKEDAEGLGGYLTFNKCYFDRTTVAAFCENLLYWLTQLGGALTQPLARIPYLAPAQAAQLATALDFTGVAFPEAETIVSLFARQARAVPANTAVVFNEEHTSYAALHAYSSQFAAYLQAHHQVQNQDFVAVCLPRSGHMVGALLGILQAGGCYVPIDPGYPRERIDYLVADSRSKVLVNQQVLDEFLGLRAQLPATETAVAIAPQQPAYVIYTSGTTGQPKGVVVSHRNVVRLLFNEQNLFDFNSEDAWTLFHSYCFDFSVWEMYGALLYGGKLVVVPEMVAKDTELFWQLLAEQRVTVLNQTPSAFYRLMQADAAQPTPLPALRYVIFGGEALAPYQLKAWALKYPRTQLINMYGITETTVHVTYKQINQPEIESGISNIGQPIPTLGCYILSPEQQPVPRGVVGELYVAGEGVAAGYLNQQELTTRRFVELPAVPGQRLYRSGDLARITLNGDLEYLGRIDNQVKIRGHRIELGELENNLLKHEQVDTAVVVALRDEDEDSFLAAYYTSESALSAKELKLYLQLLVPPYMVPGYFVCVPAIPLTSNGKVDRSKLPNPKAYVEEEATLYVAARNAVEHELVAIWLELLGVPKVSVKDNFFDLGGHSLKATQLISRISERLGASLRLSDIFAHPILEELAQILPAPTSAPTPPTVLAPCAERDGYPLSAAQKRLWVLQQMQADSSAYNMSSAYVLPAQLDPGLLAGALAQLLARHEILRTVFRQNEQEQVQQWVLPALEIREVFTYHPGVLPLEAIAARFRADALQPFDLAAAPLLKIALYQTDEAQCVLGYVMHHIISDGWSMNVFFSELLALYHGLEQQQAVPLAPLPFQYKDYAVWYHEQLEQGALAAPGAYWQEQFRDGWPRLDLARQKPRPAVKTSAGALAEFTIPAPQLRAFGHRCHGLGGSLFMGLFTLVNALIARHTALTDVVLGVPTAGRDFVSVEQQVGCYINTLALRTRFSLDDTLAQLFETVKQGVLAGFDNQRYPFDKLVEDLKLKPNASRSPLFDIMVVLQNTQDVQVAAGAGRSALPDLGVQPLAYTGESSKFDLTWFFVETEHQELLLRLEYNTDLYEADTIQQLGRHFTTLLHLFLEPAGHPLRTLALLAPAEPALAPATTAPMEYAGRFSAAEPAAESFEAAVGPKETKLLAVWQEVLAADNIGRTDDFFALGGDSIKAIQLVAKLKKHQLHLSVAEAMQHPTLQRMAAVLRDEQVIIEEEIVHGIVPLSPIQQYFFAAVTTAPEHYNQSVVLHSARPVDLNRLTAVLRTLAERHDMLRAGYYQENGAWVQEVRTHPDVALEVHGFPDLALADNLATVERLSDHAQASFDLATGPLFKCVLYQHHDQDAVLLCAHHLIIDGVSWRILLEDFETLYAEAPAARAPQPLPRTHSYRKWVQHLQALADSALLQDAGARWQAVERQLSTLPKDAPQAPNREQDAVQLHVQLSAAQTQALVQAAHRVLKADVQDLLVAGLGQSLHACFAVEQLGLVMESHGRNSAMQLDLSRTVGWFTAMFPVLLPRCQPDALLYLMEVKEAIREYAGVGSQYGIWRYLAADKPAPAPPADMCFNYLGQFQAASAAGDAGFTLSTEGKGAERNAQQPRLFAVDATAAIADQELQLSLRYSARQYQPATMQHLLEQWHEQLLRLVAACEAAENNFLTASDLTAEQVEPAALLKLQKEWVLEDVYPLSPMQQSFYYYHARYPASTAYFEQTRYRLRGALQPALVTEALRELARRHGVMRTLFVDNLGAEVLQVVLADRLPEDAFIDLLGEEAPEVILDHYAEQDRARGFDLQRELPLRWRLFRLQDDVFELVLSYHHIIMDGWCMPLIMQEFQALYTAASRPAPVALPTPPAYVNYINWLHAYPAAAGKEYWRQYLSGYVGPANIGREEETHELVRDLATVEFTVAGEPFARLQQAVRETGTTLNELTQTLWSVYLGSKNQRNDVVFGTVVSGRPAELEGVEAMVGLFINTIPVRVRFERPEPLRDVLDRVRAQAIAALPYHYTPLSHMPRGRSAQALFDHVLVFRNYPMAEAGQAPWELLHVKSYEPNNLDFSLHVLPSPTELTIRFVYLPGRFAAADIGQIREAFAGMITRFCQQPALTVADLQEGIEAQRHAQRKSSVKQRLVSLKK